MAAEGSTLFRNENGKTKPPVALVKLLYILDRHQELLEESWRVRGGWKEHA
uniref:Uncharacterized protein n=1 Tax=mine drainage metagenome TaxID=410659 RepID=E6QI72_9ZZZZ